MAAGTFFPDRHPEIKELLRPVKADDGIFWVTKEEFGQYDSEIAFYL
jgi:hypothetical protein